MNTSLNGGVVGESKVNITCEMFNSRFEMLLDFQQTIFGQKFIISCDNNFRKEKLNLGYS